MSPSLEALFRTGKIIVHPSLFTIAQYRKVTPDSMIVIQDGREITCILPQEKVNQEDVIKMDKDWRLLTFDMDIPLSTVGFFAEITRVLAEAGVGVDIYSAFSTDHLLIKDVNLEKAKRALQGLGFTFS